MPKSVTEACFRTKVGQIKLSFVAMRDSRSERGSALATPPPAAAAAHRKIPPQIGKLLLYRGDVTAKTAAARGRSSRKKAFLLCQEPPCTAAGLVQVAADFYTSPPYLRVLRAADVLMRNIKRTWSLPGGLDRYAKDDRVLRIVLGIALLLPAEGCVRRRLNVRTNPPGALVYVDNQQIGTTPCSVDFTYYGTREIRLIKPGFETLTVNQPIPTPWYEIPPLDFISENLVAAKIRDNRTVAFNLSPALVVPKEQLLERANQLRQD